jgi:hypothetical protein
LQSNQYITIPSVRTCNTLPILKPKQENCTGYQLITPIPYAWFPISNSDGLLHSTYLFVFVMETLFYVTSFIS